MKHCSATPNDLQDLHELNEKLRLHWNRINKTKGHYDEYEKLSTEEIIEYLQNIRDTASTLKRNEMKVEFNQNIQNQLNIMDREDEDEVEELPSIQDIKEAMKYMAKDNILNFDESLMDEMKKLDGLT